MMQDPLTDLPPPSRFLLEDLNNFASPDDSVSLPHPFIAWNRILNFRPKLLLVALSKSSCHLVHYLPKKKIIGTFVLPEVSMAGNALQPSLQDKSCCLLYALEETENPTVVLASVQYTVPAERSTTWTKTLLREVRPEKVVVMGSIPSQHFRGKLSSDETLIFKLETLAERLDENDGALKGVPYYPSGSMIDGLAAALLTQCQVTKLKGQLLVSWPDYDASVVNLLNSVLKKVCPAVDFSVSAKTPLFKALRVDSDLYT